MKIDKQRYYVAEGIRARGGYFIQQIGKALGSADATNTQKIKDGWPEDWAHFLETGIVLEERARKVKICRSCGVSDDEQSTCLNCVDEKGHNS